MKVSLDGGETYHDFDLDSVGFQDALLVEKHLGIEWLDFLRAMGPQEDGAPVVVSQMAKLQVLAWLALREDEPDLAISDINTPLSKFTFEGDEEVEGADPLASGSTDSDDDTASSSTRSMASSLGSGTA